MEEDQEKTQVPEENQKLRVKLKIHRDEQQEGEEGGGEDFAIGPEISPQKKDEPRVCQVCNKGFSSGKALGGHMRVHVQANKEQQQQQEQQQHLLPLKRKHNGDNAGAGNGPPVCSLCGKNFPSMKSLFGHMRCHPDREWRGIQPPPPPATPTPPSVKNSSPTSSVSDQIDLSECLRGWSSTAKRGRGALTDSPAPAAVQPAEEERLHEAVQYLMKLAHGDSFDSDIHPTHENRADHEGRNGSSAGIEDENWVLESSKRGIEGVGYDNHPVKKLKIEGFSGSPENLEEGKGKAAVLGDTPYSEKFVEDDETESQNSDYLIVNYSKCNDDQMKNKRKRKKKMKLRDLNPIYKCSTCDRCFPTHQALGGHRSSHNKIRNPNIIELQEDNDTQVPNHPPATGELKENEEGGVGGGGGGSKVVVAETSSTTAHQCKICNKTFPTGQALGGHKRCHWTSSPPEAPLSQAGGSSGEAAAGRKILGFDLNEVPPMEEVESEHHAAGFAYASSSPYNSQ